jgi:hypothetical protein
VMEGGVVGHELLEKVGDGEVTAVYLLHPNGATCVSNINFFRHRCASSVQYALSWEKPQRAQRF